MILPWPKKKKIVSADKFIRYKYTVRSRNTVRYPLWLDMDANCCIRALQARITSKSISPHDSTRLNSAPVYLMKFLAVTISLARVVSHDWKVYLYFMNTSIVLFYFSFTRVIQPTNFPISASGHHCSVESDCPTLHKKKKKNAQTFSAAVVREDEDDDDEEEVDGALAPPFLMYILRSYLERINCSTDLDRTVEKKKSTREIGELHV